jgi:hypothetical protein
MRRILGARPRSSAQLQALFACLFTLIACDASDDDAGGQVPTTMRVPDDGDGSPGDGGDVPFVPTPRPGAGTSPPSTAGDAGGALPDEVSDRDALSSLDGESALAVCDALDARFEAAFGDADAERLACALFGVLFSAVPDGMGGATIDVATCRQWEQECLTGGGGLTSATQCDSGRFVVAAADCPLSVRDYELCFDAQLAALLELIDVVSCDAPADPALLDAAARGGDPASVPECEAFVAQCPALVTSPDDPGPTGTPAKDGCDETCEFTADGECDDGGPGSLFGFCPLGTDCIDCGPRAGS